MDEILTLEQIEARYAPDWVLIAEPQTDDGLHLLGGKVVYHGKDPDELYRKASELGLTRIAVRYLGEWPDDVALNLASFTGLVCHQPAGYAERGSLPR